MATFKVEIEVSATHTFIVDDVTDADEAARSAEYSLMDGNTPDDVGWPSTEVQRITEVAEDGDGCALRVMRLYDFATRGWRYVATDDSTNKDLSMGHGRDSVIRQGWAKLTEVSNA